MTRTYAFAAQAAAANTFWQKRSLSENALESVQDGYFIMYFQT